MRECEKCYLIGISVGKWEKLEVDLFEEVKKNGNEVKEMIEKCKL